MENAIGSGIIPQSEIYVTCLLELVGEWVQWRLIESCASVLRSREWDYQFPRYEG